MKYFLVSVAQLVRAGQGSCVVTPVGHTGLVAPHHALSGGHTQSGALSRWISDLECTTLAFTQSL